MGLLGLAATAIVAKAQGIYDKLKISVLYTDPVPPLVTFKANIDTLAAANAAADVNGGKADYQAKREALKVVKADLKTLLAYVQAISGSDPDKILSSGFELVKRASPYGELNPPQKLSSRFSTMAGRASIFWEGAHGADTYLVYKSSSNDPFKWEPIGATTKRSFHADRLESGVNYWFAVSAVGAAGETSKSEPLLARAA